MAIADADLELSLLKQRIAGLLDSEKTDTTEVNVDTALYSSQSIQVHALVEEGGGQPNPTKKPCVSVGVDVDLASESSEGRQVRDDSESDATDDGLSEIDPLWTERQQQMDWYLEAFGIIGLAHVIKDIAEYERREDISLKIGKNKGRRRRRYPDPAGNGTFDGVARPIKKSKSTSAGRGTRPGRRYTVPDFEDDSDVDTFERGSDEDDGHESDSEYVGHSSWRTILGDLEKGPRSRVLFYLASWHPDLVLSLIHGTLPSDLQNPDFERDISRYIQLKGTPGSYTLWTATNPIRRNTQADDRSERYVGYGLSIADLEKAWSEMRRYIDIERTDAAAILKAKKIDGQRGGNGKGINYRKGERLFGGGKHHDQFERQRFFLNYLESGLLQWARQPGRRNNKRLRQRHLKRCFVYTGLSWNVLGRAVQHWPTGKKDSIVYCLLQSVLRSLFGDKYDVVEFSYQTLKATRREDLGLGEILMTIVTSSVLWDGGLNVYAGVNFGKRDYWDNEHFLEMLKDNARSIRGSGFVLKSIEDTAAKISRTARALELLDREKVVDAKLRHLLLKIGLEDDTEETEDHVDELRETLDFLDLRDVAAAFEVAMASAPCDAYPIDAAGVLPQVRA
ncbi:hypothetical protein A1O7_06730 [Cladophialophora yegresii CBS 114405]|uniref:Uncharacterized protein n=1 Tax=Cladophialophora yegresii CBS 114405 TaxID=1182544 RepID=W9VL46_9EURO|nr:uncharacterized protein A1O7_06730 [Cladophialophora yegresii CBS 114405]EXJ56387.1 hypothetical protein A1O7_06730 [Cladophialophora yegresii CBS 114405]